MRRDRLLLTEILEAVVRITGLTDEHSLDDFESDRDRRDALLWNFTVLGEAVGQLSDATKDAHPALGQVPLRVVQEAEAHHVGMARSDTVERVSLPSQGPSGRSQNMSVGVIIEHHVRPGSRDSVRAIWEEFLRPAIMANAAHEAYAYMYDVDDPDVIRAFQQYTDTEAASAFLTTPAYAAYVSAVEGLLVGSPSVMRTDVIWTK